MEISTLKLFVEVMRQRSFTEAAKLARLAPSSVSRAIATLETELGIRLFQRSTRKLEPTEAGLIYFERIAPMVEELDAARQMAMDINEQPTGKLRVTAPIVFGQKFIVSMLPEMQNKFPSLEVELVLTDTYLDLIGERMDVAIRLGSLQDSNYIAKRLRKMRFYICASPDYLMQHGTPKTPNEIRDHECLLFPRQGHTLNWLFKETNDTIVEVPISGRYTITHSDAVRESALSGMGLALLPDWLIEQDLHSKALISLFNDFDVTATDFESAIWMLYPSREYVPLKVRVFMELLTDRYAI